jgi:hypothetical protein
MLDIALTAEDTPESILIKRQEESETKVSPFHTCPCCHQELPIQLFYQLHGRHLTRFETCQSCRDTQVAASTAIPPGYKSCSRCKSVFNIEHFYRRGDGGRQCWCRTCRNEYSRSTKAKKREGK